MIGAWPTAKTEGETMTLEHESQLKELWAKWVRQAAEERGVTVQEITAKLEAGEISLEISATFPPQLRQF